MIKPTRVIKFMLAGFFSLFVLIKKYPLKDLLSSFWFACNLGGEEDES
jgi:hypothetical protein